MPWIEQLRLSEAVYPTSWSGKSYLDAASQRKDEGNSRAVPPFINPWSGIQSGGGAPVVVTTKAPVKKCANVKIAPKQSKVRDFGVEFVVQPAIVPPNLDPVWLEVSREKAVVQFLNLRSKTSEITTSWTTELELGKKTDLGETLMILSSVSVLLHSNLEVGFVVLDFEADDMTPESLRDSCVRSSIVVKIFEDKASLMCITPGLSFKSTSVVRLIDNYLLVAMRGFIGAGLFAIQRPSTPAIAYPSLDSVERL